MSGPREVVEVRERASKKPRFSEEIIQDCLRVLTSEDVEELFELIPRLGVLRDPRFNEPLKSLLSQNDLRKREFAAYAMGAIGSLEFLAPLKEAYTDAAQGKGFSAEEFLMAIIEAIGAIGDDTAVEFFQDILRTPPEGPKAGTKLRRRIVEALGTIAQQGGQRSSEALLELTQSKDIGLRAQALSELSIAYWHRPNEIPDQALRRIHESTGDRHHTVAESALAALQSLADVGCERAEKLFSSETW